MSLIEQLGGYERANNIAHNYSNDRDRVIQCSSKDIEYTGDPSEIANINLVEFSISDLRSAVLKYRRQHNIFEESDKIVFIDDFMHGELMTVAWTRKGEVWMDEGAKRCTDLSMIRHATDAEIKVGSRL